MKRKRGHKKGKPKGSTNPVISANGGGQNKEETYGLDEFDIGNDKEDNSGMEVDTPSSTGTDQHYNLANINPDGSIDKAAGKSVGRVKVKLRTPKILDSQRTSSDAPTQSDTDKSSQQHGLEKQGVNVDRIEDSANSLPDMKLGAPSKKAGSIKIKSSKVLGLNADQTSKPLSVSSETTHPKERKAPQQNPRYNKQELDASLMVIRKVMKMDAAEPFNVPVNPEALGIPDYFDIITTPMDFGTICSNLEKDDKYMNSEDVFKDVQYIWDNCYKYNNKGDYILDLMRRVKKNFMKYWTAAGLYSEQPKGVERTTPEDIALSGDGKVRKGGQLKHKTKKRHGRHHKHDCLCAICVLKRRRKEREENDRIAKGNFGSGGDKHAREFKQEESVLVESPGGEDSSSNTDESLGTDADEDKGEVAKMETSEKQCSPSEGRHDDNNVDDDDDDDEEEEEEEEEDDHGPEEKEEGEEEEEEEDGEGEDEEEIDMDSQKRQMDESLKHDGTLAEKSNVGDTTILHDEYKTKEQEGQAAVVQQQKKHKGSQDRHQKAKLLESFCFENPKLSSLCGTLFTKNSQSVWSGPHSLIHQRNSARTSSIHVAIGTFMK